VSLLFSRNAHARGKRAAWLSSCSRNATRGNYQMVKQWAVFVRRAQSRINQAALCKDSQASLEGPFNSAVLAWVKGASRRARGGRVRKLRAVGDSMGHPRATSVPLRKGRSASKLGGIIYIL
jgi:hypothetical protein